MLMNIFETKQNFFGDIEDGVTETTLISLFQFAKEVQNRLGKKAYLLDCYLSIFFEAISKINTYDTTDNGLAESNKLQDFFSNLLEDSNGKEWSPFCEQVIKFFQYEANKMPYQEQYTKICLLMILIADDRMIECVWDFVVKSTEDLCTTIDEKRMNELYEQISCIVGESMMEELNLKLKQRFLIAPAALIFAQGMNRNLVDIFITRDKETSRQMFQLFLDRLPQIE